MAYTYFTRKRQSYNWFYDNTEAGIQADQIAVNTIFLANPTYYALWTTSQRSLAISRGFDVPEFVVESDWLPIGFGAGWNPSTGAAVVPGSPEVQHNEYMENPSWAPTWNYGALMVGYYEEYRTEWVDSSPPPPGPIFLLPTPVPDYGPLPGIEEFFEGQGLGIRLYRRKVG